MITQKTQTRTRSPFLIYCSVVKGNYMGVLAHRGAPAKPPQPVSDLTELLWINSRLLPGGCWSGVTGYEAVVMHR